MADLAAIVARAKEPGEKHLEVATPPKTPDLGLASSRGPTVPWHWLSSRATRLNPRITSVHPSWISRIATLLVDKMGEPLNAPGTEGELTSLTILVTDIA
jgi:hypothetical protein